MNILKKIFTNVWLKRFVALLCYSYGLVVLYASYLSVFYRVDYVNDLGFLLANSVVALCYLLLMIYSRRQVFMGILCMLLPLLAFPMVLMNFGEWYLIAPPMLLIITMFFVCRGAETLKTIVGTMYLLLYIVGVVGYLLLVNIFLSPTENTVLNTYVSDSGAYRAYVVDVNDNASGRTEVYVEPNDLDIDYELVIFRAKGYDKRIYVERNHEEPTIDWRGDLLYINDKPYEFTIGERRIVLD